ncbi:MAG: HAMP domain-containing histidine kinase, partial [Bacteroidia bacterium]|nr:HAMP domain-containing histidine kinase [Bacteroidia bacterium]
MSVSPRRDVNKNIVGAICVGQDLTEVIRYRQGLERMVDDRTRELNVALQKEKELVEMKSKFVSIASHEFRTPLTTISIASGFIKKYKHKLNPGDIDQKLANIDKQVDHMTHLLDDVLMIGKSEAGKIMINVDPVDLADLIRQLVSEVEQSTRKSHDIIFSFDTRYRTFNTDEKLIRNIVINILTNAIKFSPGKDKVYLVADDQLELLRIQVRDEGLGIPEDDMKNLFGSFYRASNVASIQGTGLGLSIVKKAVELLQGSIKVESQLGRGTTVTITLPNLNPASTTPLTTPTT